jgi:hypothetical protein
VFINYSDKFSIESNISVKNSNFGKNNTNIGSSKKIYSEISNKKITNSNTPISNSNILNKNITLNSKNNSPSQINKKSDIQKPKEKSKEKSNEKSKEKSNYTYLDVNADMPNIKIDGTTNFSKDLSKSKMGSQEDDNWKELVFKIKLTEAEYKLLLREKSNAVAIK